MVKLTMIRYGKKLEFTHETLRDAARDACTDVETNEASPVSIEENGVVVWENGGPFDGSYDRLRDLAELSDDEA